MAAGNIRYLTFEESMKRSFNANYVNIFRVVPEGGQAIMRGFSNAVQNDDYITLGQANSLYAGAGSGDMLKATYDPTNQNTDIFDFGNILTGNGDANALDIANLDNLEAVSMTDVAGGGFTATIAGNFILFSGGVLSLDAGSDVVFGAGAGLANVNMEQITGSVIFPDGDVVNPAMILGDDADGIGFYKVSLTQGGGTVGNALVWGWDAAGLFTGTVSEQIGGVGVTVTGTAGSLILMQNVADSAYILLPASTADHAQVNWALGINPITPDPGDAWYNNVGTKGHTFQGASGATVLVGAASATPILIQQDTGWTACTGTESKAGIDSNDVIYTAGALQNLARTVAAIQNTLMTSQRFFTT